MRALRDMVAAIALMTLVASAQTARPILEVVRFEVPSAAALPTDFQDALASNLLARLGESGKFSSVVGSDKAGAGEQPTIRLTGEITDFKKGSQAKRYLLGPGFGKTVLKAHVRFIDIRTGKVLLERDVDGKVIIGLLGGDSRGATNGLAKEVAKVAKKWL